MSTRLPSETVPGRTDPHPNHTNAVGSGKRCLLTSAVLLAAAAGLAAVALQIDGQTQELTVGVLTLAPLTASGTGDQLHTSQSGAGPPAVVVAGHEADFDAAANAKTFQALRLAITGRSPAPVTPQLQALLDDYIQKSKAGTLRGSIVFYCRTAKYCSGLGDRLRGIRVLFWFAVVMESNFYIKDDDSTSLYAWVQPNVLDTTMPPGVHKPSIQNRWVFHDDSWGTVSRTLAQNGFVLTADNSINHKNTFGKLQDRDAVNKTRLNIVVDGEYPLQLMWDTVFAPKPEFLQSSLIPALRQSPVFTSPGPRVCTQIRTQWADDTRLAQQPWGMQMVHETLDCFMSMTADVYSGINTSNDTVSLLLATDAPPSFIAPHNKLPEGLRKVPFPTQVVPFGTPAGRAHVSFHRHTDMGDLGAEFIALSFCDVMVHSRSGFSQTAAWLGGLPASNVRVMPRGWPVWNATVRPWNTTVGKCPPFSYWPWYSTEIVPPNAYAN